MKVLTVIGARPQFIKAAPLSRALKQKGIEEIVVHTGQHFDPNMSTNFFQELGLEEPAYNLNISGLSHGAMTGRMLEALDKVLLKEKVDLVIVFGDTNSTLAGALAAKKLGFPVAHIEAGMRSGLEYQPEEINRILSDELSNLLFTSSTAARDHLLKEGFPEERIIESGDIMLDLFKAEAQAKVEKSISLPQKPYALLTLHRQENVDDPEKLKAWIEALNALSEEIKLVMPLHPRTRARLQEIDLKLKASFIEPCGHREIIDIIKNSELVITDSGGLQKEAYFCRKICLTLREATEWTELVDAGLNLLCSPENLLQKYQGLKVANLHFPNFYGEGNAADIIVEGIAKFLQQRKSQSH